MHISMHRDGERLTAYGERRSRSWSRDRRNRATRSDHRFVLIPMEYIVARDDDGKLSSEWISVRDGAT